MRFSSRDRGMKAISRASHRRELGILGSVWVVAVETVIASASPLGQIPMPGHATVRPVLIVPKLRPMTLGTQRHRFRERQRATIRQLQRAVAILRIMTADARQLTMGHFQPLMKLIQVDRQGRVGVRLSKIVTRETLQSDWLTVSVHGSRRDAMWKRWLPNDHGVELGGRRIHSCDRWRRFCPRLVTLTSPREASQQAGCGDEATGEDQRTGHGDRHVLNEVSVVGPLYPQATDQ